MFHDHFFIMCGVNAHSNPDHAVMYVLRFIAMGILCVLDFAHRTARIDTDLLTAKDRLL